MTTVDFREFQECVSALIDRAQKGEAVTITKQGRPVAQLIPTELATQPGEIVRPGDGSRHMPTPIKLRGTGPSSDSYVAECRR